uniref:La-related protein 6C n=1 Tax=Ananas comosus var. bracteatus TaxID=296719 RepID=A0A6V7NKX2_ANACO|nr:unnamed protein product [Ananas comosus var. bracteatus]
MAQEINKKEEEKVNNNNNSDNNNNDNNTGLNKEDSEANGRGNKFKLNVNAPEFVPRSSSASPGMSLSTGYFYPYLQFPPGGAGAAVAPDWVYFADHDPILFAPDFHAKINPAQFKSSADIVQKIVKQVEYQFSDTNLVANDFLMKIMNKDPDGYVPMSVIASWKKIKSLGASNHMLVKALRTSTKLLVSEDGKKIKRKQLFTERDKEELQSRTVIVENLPEDYSRQNLEKIFGAIGRVKNIRICHPPEPNSARSSNSDVLISNKVHAFVEYETTDQADKAVEKLNDERNWRKGLRVRTMLRRSPRSVIRSRRPEYDHFDINSEDEKSPPSQSSTAIDNLLDQSNEENQYGMKKAWGRGRMKMQVPPQNINGRGVLSQSPQSPNYGLPESPSTKQGPRMPDGTRGFTLGRGKPLASLLGCLQLPSAVLASPAQL